MSNNKNKELEELEETEVVSSNTHSGGKDCVKLSRTSFVLCVGQPYAFMIGRKTIIGIVEEVNAKFLRVVVSTDQGKVLIDLRKVSMISEVK